MKSDFSSIKLFENKFATEKCRLQGGFPKKVLVEGIYLSICCSRSCSKFISVLLSLTVKIMESDTYCIQTCTRIWGYIVNITPFSVANDTSLFEHCVLGGETWRVSIRWGWNHSWKNAFWWKLLLAAVDRSALQHWAVPAPPSIFTHLWMSSIEPPNFNFIIFCFDPTNTKYWPMYYFQIFDLLF